MIKITTLLAEKYRPKTFEEIIGLEDEVKKYTEQDIIPPLLFTGPPGTGKTTTALVIAKITQCDFMKLNASDETGIDTIRNKISKFAMCLSINKKRIILLDEADGLTPQAQQNLRGVIDKYQTNCTFILTANFDWKIIDALKSRCVNIKFTNPSEEKIVGRLKYITEKEKIEVEGDVLDRIVALTYPDIRNAIIQVERIALRNNNKILLKSLDDSTLTISVLIELLKQKKLTEATQLLENKYSDVEKFIADLADEFFYGEYTDEVKKKVVVDIMRRAYVEICRVKNYKPIIRPMLYEIMQVI